MCCWECGCAAVPADTSLRAAAVALCGDDANACVYVPRPHSDHPILSGFFGFVELSAFLHALFDLKHVALHLPDGRNGIFVVIIE